MLACTLSPQPGVHHHHRGVGLAGDLDLDLADADGLDQDPAAPDRIEQPDGLGRGQRQTAEVTAGRHRTDEHPGVGGVVLHAHPVAQDRAAGERRRRVDGQHGHLDVLAAQVSDERRW